MEDVNVYSAIEEKTVPKAFVPIIAVGVEDVLIINAYAKRTL